MRKPKKFNPHPFDYHQEIELEISSLSNLGVGIARVQLEDQGEQSNQCGQDEAQQGWVVFVPHTLPGEKVLARIFRNDKSHSQADLVDVLVPSTDRLEPKCSLFGRCGGCQYQHLSYDKQLAWKTRQVEELLEHMAGVHTDVSPAIPSPRQWGYRSKITPHFKRPRDGKIGDIGFLLAGQRSHLVDVPHCPIAMGEINDALPRIRDETRNNAKTYKKDATLLLRATEGHVETNHRNPISETVTTDAGDITFHFLAGDFFQNNPFILLPSPVTSPNKRPPAVPTTSSMPTADQASSHCVSRTSSNKSRESRSARPQQTGPAVMLNSTKSTTLPSSPPAPKLFLTTLAFQLKKQPWSLTRRAKAATKNSSSNSSPLALKKSSTSPAIQLPRCVTSASFFSQATSSLPCSPLTFSRRPDTWSA